MEGSVIDFSKLVALFKNNISHFKNNFQNSADLLNTVPIIAIPTTALVQNQQNSL